MSDIRLVEPIETEITEPDVNGGYYQRIVTKWSYQCLGCGLVWPMKWHAETCESRKHVTRWMQHYPKGPIVNGRPSRVDSYPRSAIKRLPI